MHYNDICVHSFTIVRRSWIDRQRRQQYVLCRIAIGGHINNWTYQGFINYMHQQQFELIEGFMKGAWIPFPPCLTHTSYQIPFSPSSEYYNTNFFYVFRVKK